MDFKQAGDQLNPPQVHTNRVFAGAAPPTFTRPTEEWPTATRPFRFAAWSGKTANCQLPTANCQLLFLSKSNPYLRFNSGVVFASAELPTADCHPPIPLRGLVG